MSSKAEVIEKISPTTTYIGSKVRSFVNEVSCEDSVKPTILKKGDLITTFAGVKSRPAVITKVFQEYVVAIPLTSGENIHKLCPSRSRFIKDGWFCNQYVIVPTDLALQNFISVYDNMRALNNAIKELRLFIVKNI